MNNGFELLLSGAKVPLYTQDSPASYARFKNTKFTIHTRNQNSSARSQWLRSFQLFFDFHFACIAPPSPQKKIIYIFAFTVLLD